MKKVYDIPVMEVIGLNTSAYLCQASSQTPKMSISESTNSSETVF